MSDDSPTRIPNSAVAEFSDLGELVFRIEQKPPAECGDEQLAGMVVALRRLADDLENDWLEQDATTIIDDDDFDVLNHDPKAMNSA